MLRGGGGGGGRGEVQRGGGGKVPREGAKGRCQEGVLM